MNDRDIETLHQEISETIGDLRLALAHLDDIYDMAYAQRRGPGSEKVRGGSRDYALDNVGDRSARDLTDAFGTELELVKKGRWVPASDERTWVPGLRELMDDVRSFLTDGKIQSRRDKAADATPDEVLEAIDRQKHRAPDAYTPVKVVDQPPVIPRTDWRAECEALRSAVRKTTRDFAEDHQHCRPPHDGTTRFKRQLLRRYPTKNLSTREREAWRRAVQLVAASVKDAAS